MSRICYKGATAIKMRPCNLHVATTTHVYQYQNYLNLCSTFTAFSHQSVSKSNRLYSTHEMILTRYSPLMA